MNVQIDPLEKAIVELMHAERMKQGISVKGLAAAIGISRGAIHHIENGRARPTLWIMLRMATGLNRRLASFEDEAIGRQARGA